MTFLHLFGNEDRLLIIVDEQMAWMPIARKGFLMILS